MDKHLRIIDINKDVVHAIFQFLSLIEVYTQIRYTNKYFNVCAKSFVHRHEKLIIDFSRLENMINNIESLRLPSKVSLDGLTLFDPSYSKLIENLSKSNVTELELKNCKMKTNAQTSLLENVKTYEKYCLPKSLKKLDLYFSDRDTQLCLIGELIEKKINPNTLVIIHTQETFGSNDFHDETIQLCFNLNVRKLAFGYKFTSEHLINVKNDDLLLLMKNEKLKSLTLAGMYFDESCNNFECFRNNQLKYLFLIKCNVCANDVKNLISPSIKKLGIMGNKSQSKCDNIIEQFCILKNEKIFNATYLDLQQTNITSACFKYLNSLQLGYLDVSSCYDLLTFDKLNIPTLTSFYARGNNMNDYDVQHILKMPITKLNLFRSPSITNKTLQHIFDHKTTLEYLHVGETSITLDGLINFLSGSKLKFLGISKSVFDRDKLLNSNVITNCTVVDLSQDLVHNL